MDQQMDQKSMALSEPRSGCPGFTNKQGQYLAFIWAYGLINARGPAECDMQRFFGVTAPSIHQMVLHLERDGLIRRQAGMARSIELLIAHNCCLSCSPAIPSKPLCSGTS